MKTCSHCKAEKPLTEFYKNKTRKDGLQCACKVCNRRALKAYRETNREHVNQYQKEQRAKNQDYHRDLEKRYRVKHKELRAERYRHWASTHQQNIAMYGQREVRLLKDNYIKNLLRETKGITTDCITQDLIVAKRLHIQIIRKLKELKA